MELVQIDNRKNIKSLIEPKSQEELIAKVKASLDDPSYNFVVTAENYADIKAPLAELNNAKKSINSFRIAKVKSESEDHVAFKNNMDALIVLIDAKHEEISSKGDTFYQAKIDEHSKACKEYLTEKYDELEIRDEFRSFAFKSSISELRGTRGGLKSTIVKPLDLLVTECQGKQSTFDLAEIQKQQAENERIAKAVEAKRIEIEEKAKADARREADEALAKQKAEFEAKQNPAPNIPVQEPIHTPAEPVIVGASKPFSDDVIPAQQEAVVKPVEGKKIVRVEVFIDVPVPSRVPSEAVAKKVYDRLIGYGIDEEQLVSVKAI